MKKIISIILIVCFLLTSCVRPNKNNSDFIEEISYTAIDVGQGDATLVKTDNTTVLVDCGPGSKAKNLLTYLDEENVKEIDLLIITHYHEDHIGGADDVILNFDVENVIIPNREKDLSTKASANLFDAMTEKNIEPMLANTETPIEFENVIINFLLDGKDFNDDENNGSVVSRIIYENVSFLITGDIEKEAVELLMKTNNNIKSNILKVPHHGSKTSTTEEFIYRVSPKYATISCGINNRYNHPSPETIQILQILGVNSILRTDISSHIKLVSDGEIIREAA